MKGQDASGSSDQSQVAVLASLRAAPRGGGVLPPVVTKPVHLPLNELSWSDVERLFLRLAEQDHTAEHAQRYGTPGQYQAGIDLVIRNRKRPLSAEPSAAARRYTTLQSKHVKDLTATQIREAVDTFLTGNWAPRSESFIYATTHDLTPVQLAEELIRQADRLEQLDILLVPWGRSEISEMLRKLPQVVDDFFGHAWVEAFCGDVAAHDLRHGSGTRWPRQVGLVPRVADAFQERDLSGVPSPSAAGTSQWPGAVCHVLTGMGGVGKTQIAARLAHQHLRQKSVDLVVWVNAASRQEIRQAYGRAGAEVAGADPADVEAAPEVFLAWLNTTELRWFIVLDDLQDPADLHQLWPPERSRGQILVTTRRRDPALLTSTRCRVEVGPFSPGESETYLTGRLQPHDLSTPQEELSGLARDLGHLPLALAQAASYVVDLADTGLTVSQYRARLRNRRPLSELSPEHSALPDDQDATLAVVLALSLARADQCTGGIATPLLQLASLLDPTGIPTDVFGTRAAVDHLAKHRVLPPAAEADRDAEATEAGQPVVATEVTQGLRMLHRLSLIGPAPSSTRSPSAHPTSGRPSFHSLNSFQIHALTQHAAHDTVPDTARTDLARTVAKALLEAWPDRETDPHLAQMLRTNTAMLHDRSAAALWTDPADESGSVLLRAAYSFGEVGLLAASASFYSDLLASARSFLGDGHQRVLVIRGRHASVRGEAGDVAGAVEAYRELLTDLERILGPRHPETRTVRAGLIHWRGRAGEFTGSVADASELLSEIEPTGGDILLAFRLRNDLAQRQGESGDAAGAVKSFQKLLADWRSVLGNDDTGVLTVRGNLAHWHGESGDVQGAIRQLEKLLIDQLDIIGPHHTDILITRGNLAHWRGTGGNVRGAIKDLEELLVDQLDVLGPNHPDTFNTRHSLITWRGKVEGPAQAVPELEQLLDEQQQALGKDHPEVLSETRLELAGWRVLAGDLVGAVSDCEKLLDDQRRVLGDTHPAVRRTLRLLAQCRGHVHD